MEIEFIKDGYVYDRKEPALTKAELLSKLDAMISKHKPPEQ
jgi:hypothetical protein